MTAPGIARALVLLLGLTLAITACGPAATATGGPGATMSAVVTPAPATQGPAATDGGIPSFDLSSFHGDVDLEGLLPDEIGGDPVQKLSMEGESFLEDGGSSSEDFVAILAQFGKSPADLSVAFGGTTTAGGNVDVQITAFRVDGVNASQLFDAFVQVVGTAQGDVISDASISGKAVKKIVSVDGDTSYGYASGDVLFNVDSIDEIPADLLNEIFSKLR